MLLNYTVSNFKSIGHNIQFTMLPHEKIDEAFTTKIKTKMGDWQVLRRASLFGPNASGKSTFIESVYFAQNYILNGQKSGIGTGVDQFKGDLEDLKGISTFQFMMYIDGEVYDYGFSIDKKQVYEEWLRILENDDFKPIFERVTNEKGETQIEITDNLEQQNSEQRALSEILKTAMKENQKNLLFLYKLYDNGISKAEKIIDWFRNIVVIFPDSKIQNLPVRIINDEELKAFLSRNLSSLDTGVFNLSTSKKEFDFDDFAKKMKLPEEIINTLSQGKQGFAVINGKYYVFFEKDNVTKLLQLQFEHHLNNKAVEFNIEDESDGTQRLLDLLPILFGMEEDSGFMYFVDELDRSLHTKLSKYILKEFINNSQNSTNQLIFTTHDVNLINLKEFHQDEMWFIEKNSCGETRFKPFSDFSVKDNQDLIKDYLNGRFGAVPIIKGEV